MSVNVLFVCLGNICRSPAAQGIFEGLVAEAGLADAITVDSCGTAAFNIGKSPDRRSIEATARAGYDISQQIARQIEDSDYHNNDYVIAMDRSNLINVTAWAGDDFNGEINLLMHYSTQGHNAQIPDPYYDDAGKFDAVVKTIEQASRDLLAYIRKKHQL